MKSEPRIVRIPTTDQLGEAYKEAVSREMEFQGDEFTAIGKRIHDTANRIAAGTQTIANRATLGWKDPVGE